MVESEKHILNIRYSTKRIYIYIYNSVILCEVTNFYYCLSVIVLEKISYCSMPSKYFYFDLVYKTDVHKYDV